MLNSQAIKILRSLDSKEMEMLNDFIYSPFFNKSTTVHKFWEVIRSFYPDFSDDNIGKEKLFKLTFKGKKYNYGTMKNLIHNFTNLLEKFLEIKFHEEDKFQNDYNTLVYSIIKYYPDLFKKKFAIRMKEYNKISEGDDYHYLFKYQLIRLSSSFAALESKMEKTLFDQGDSLIYFFLIHLFQVNFNIKIFFDVKNYEQNNLVDELLKVLDLELIMKKIKANSEKDFKVVNLYYYMYLSTNHSENDEYYFKFKKFLFELHNVLNDYEFGSMASAVINTLQNRAYMGIKGTDKEISEFLKLLIKLKINVGNTDSKISLSNFSYNLRHFFEAEDKEYAEIFYKEYESKLLQSDKENMSNVFKAFNFYLDKDYNKALEYSAKIKNETHKFKVFVKSFQLKCYYELNEAEAFNYTLKAYRLLIYRKDTINSKRKEYSKSYLNTINALFEHKVFNKHDLGDIEVDISRNKMLNKEWIIKKLNEIKRNGSIKKEGRNFAYTQT